ncbi:MAG: decaprenyl-phosphate phosphoribosyltransferase [Dehalococcoidia bacterium]|nr:decaprenyl-phosphate phosphoribosyltransferase [Dehalococcoidia bacterium]
MYPDEPQASSLLVARRAGFGPGLLRDLIVAARPLQWQKNLLLYAAFVFSAGSAWAWREPEGWLPLLLLASAGFVLFNVISSGSYLVNDALDAEQDRMHPRKRLRPVAAGRITVQLAMSAGIVLVTGGVLLSFLLSWQFGLVALAYAALTATYSLLLKHLVIVDVLTIASGFGLRAVAGGVVIAVPISSWLVVCTLLGALYIAVAKRRQELTLSQAGHRDVLREYSLASLDQMSAVAGASAIVSYALYTVTAENLPDDNSMLLTLPFVLYGFFRYRLIAERYPERNADEMILSDAGMRVSVLLFAVTALLVLGFQR